LFIYPVLLHILIFEREKYVTRLKHKEHEELKQLKSRRVLYFLVKKSGDPYQS